jgi:mycothiol synthase
MRLRPPVPDDAPAVLAVRVARQVADLGFADETLEDLLDEWRSSDVELAADARVVESAGGEIIGYIIVARPGTLAAVHPAHEGRGAGARLLEWGERRECERGRELHRQWVAATNATARTLLTAAGYAVARSYWRMVCSLDDAVGVEVPAARPEPPPAGYRFRPVESDRDAASLHALDALSFAERPDYVPESLREFSDEHLRAHDFDAGLSLVAEHGGDLAGFLLARRWGDDAVGYVDLLAVHPRHRGRGLGKRLLATAFAAFAVAGLREAQLSVDSDNPRALRVYERAGMRIRFQYDVYERPVASPPGRR